MGRPFAVKVNSMWGRQSSIVVTLALMTEEGSSFFSMPCSPPVLEPRWGDFTGMSEPRWQGG